MVILGGGTKHEHFAYGVKLLHPSINLRDIHFIPWSEED